MCEWYKCKETYDISMIDIVEVVVVVSLIPQEEGYLNMVNILPFSVLFLCVSGWLLIVDINWCGYISVELVYIW